MNAIISIITPCLNSAPLLVETIESILGQSIFQSGKAQLQYLIIDGGSTDNTSDMVKPFLNRGVEFFSEPDQGMYHALAKGLARATGSIVGYLNAGDILFPKTFEILSEVFLHPEVDWVTGYSTLINNKLQITASWKPPRYRREFIENGYYATSAYPYGIQQESTFWSRKLNNQIDFERLRSFKLAGDYFLWTEFAKLSELHSIMSLLGAFQIHAGQLSENKEAYHAECQKIIRKATFREKVTAYWETRCNPLWKGYLWNYTLRKSQAKIFEYSNQDQRWLPR